LVLLGVFAALCAAVLVATLKARNSAPAPAADEQVEIVVATKDLAAMTVVDSNCVKVETVSKKDAPPDRIPPDRVSSAYSAVGRVLSVPLVMGQVFTEKCFAKEGSGAHLAAVLPEGMRAVSIPVEGAAGLKGLLYPGSLVDVFASFSRAPGGSGGPAGQVLSMPLIERVQVLAIETNTVFAPGEAHVDTAASRRGDNKTMVTLMVSPEDAQALQLAMGQGTLMLALRNPLDQQRKAADFRRLIDLLLRNQNPAAETEPGRVVNTGAALASTQQTAEASKQTPAAMSQPAVPQKTVEVIRGGATETVSFPLGQPDVGK
jgi:pilus assembly protein CpaB